MNKVILYTCFCFIASDVKVLLLGLDLELLLVSLSELPSSSVPSSSSEAALLSESLSVSGDSRVVLDALEVFVGKTVVRRLVLVRLGGGNSSWICEGAVSLLLESKEFERVVVRVVVATTVSGDEADEGVMLLSGDEHVAGSSF
jgi:hypothetical protein